MHQQLHDLLEKRWKTRRVSIMKESTIQTARTWKEYDTVPNDVVPTNYKHVEKIISIWGTCWSDEVACWTCPEGCRDRSSIRCKIVETFQHSTHFVRNICNVSLGLCIDEFSPFIISGRQYSLWPPKMCMKQEFIFLTILISGLKYPKWLLDVFLQPSIQKF